MFLDLFCFYCTDAHRALHVQLHSVPSRRPSDLRVAFIGGRGQRQGDDVVDRVAHRVGTLERVVDGFAADPAAGASLSDGAPVPLTLCAVAVGELAHPSASCLDWHMTASATTPYTRPQ